MHIKCRYRDCVKEAETQAIRGSIILSILIGCTFFFGTAMLGVSFWYNDLQLLLRTFRHNTFYRYGSELLVNCELEGGDSITVSIHVCCTYCLISFLLLPDFNTCAVWCLCPGSSTATVGSFHLCLFLCCLCVCHD